MNFNIKILIIHFALYIGLLSCSNKAKHPRIPNLYISTRILPNKDITQYFKSKIIKISGNDVYKLNGKVRQFKYFNEVLYLIDRQPTQMVSAIDNSGHIKWQLKPGKDPESFTTLAAFLIDKTKNTILILDDQTNKIYSYNLNGEYIKTEPLPKIYFNDAIKTNNNYIIFNVAAYRNNFDERNTKIALVSFQKDNKTINPNYLLLNQPMYNENNIPYIDYYDFVRDDKYNLFYHREFDDTIYTVDHNRANPYLTIELPNREVITEILLNNKSGLVLQELLNKNIPFYSYAIPINGLLISSYTFNNQEYFAMVDMKNGDEVFNGNKYICHGIKFEGRLDYSEGILLNQMYGGNFNQLQDENIKTNIFSKDYNSKTSEDNEIVYIILIPIF